LTDGDGKVAFPFGFQHVGDVVEAGEMPPEIDPVAVTSQPEMFQGMQARQGIAVILKGVLVVLEIDLFEFNIADRSVKRAYVANLNRSERGDMGDKAVNP
jgi:hypothetical protein